MSMPAIHHIVHPTDFSEASAEAFVHALRIALAAKCTLSILHVAAAPDAKDWGSFPQVRQTLAHWGLMRGDESPEAIASAVGVKVVKAELKQQSPINGILRYIAKHPADLLVLATEARQGVERWLQGSVAEDLAREVMTPSLFVPAMARGFVDPARGEVSLRHALIPIDHHPKPADAIDITLGFAQLIAGDAAEARLLHIGRRPPHVEHHADPHRPLPIALRQGDVVDTIIAEARDWPADLIGMPTVGRDGFLDALRGSTTERVIRQAPCPVLAVPAGR